MKKTILSLVLALGLFSVTALAKDDDDRAQSKYEVKSVEIKAAQDSGAAQSDRETTQIQILGTSFDLTIVDNGWHVSADEKSISASKQFVLNYQQLTDKISNQEALKSAVHKDASDKCQLLGEAQYIEQIKDLDHSWITGYNAKIIGSSDTSVSESASAAKACFIDVVALKQAAP